jgi:phosphomannomutase
MLQGIRHFRIVIDTSNGATSLIAPKFFERLRQQIIMLNNRPDGNFPSHVPNPMIESALHQAIHAVKQNKADLGIVFDGDGDRIRVIDETGKPVRSDVLFGILADYELSRKKFGIYYADLRVSKSVEELIGKRARFKRLPVGNPYFKVALQKKMSIMAGELSGHIMYKEHYGIDDGFFAALKLLQAMSKYGRLSSLARPFHKYFYSGEMNFKVNNKDEVIKKVMKRFKGCKVSRLDGITVEADDFWFNLRKSNTENLVRLVIETKSRSRMSELKTKLVQMLK